MTTKVLWLLLPIFLLSACKKPSAEPTLGSEPDTPPLVAMSIFPLTDLAKRIAGDRIEVYQAMPHGADPHHYELPPSMVNKIKSASRVVAVHPDFDGWLTKYVSKAQIYFLSDRMVIDRQDVHFWLSIRQAKIACFLLAELFGDLHSDTDFFQQNLDGLLDQMSLVDKQIKSDLESISGQKFLQWHGAWNHFAADYGLQLIGTIQTGHHFQFSAHNLANITRLIENDNIAAIIVDQTFAKGQHDRLLEKLSVPIIELDTLGGKVDPRDSYLGLLRFNADQILAGVENRKRGLGE